MIHTTILVIEHEDGQSMEGAIKLRNDVDHFAANIGLDVVAAMTEPGDHARAVGMRMIVGGDDGS